MKTLIRRLYGGREYEYLRFTANICAFIEHGKYEKQILRMRDELRNIMASGSKARPQRAEKLPAVNWSYGENYNGRIMLSLDFKDDTQLAALRRMVNALPQTFCTFVGSSATTLKVVLAYCHEDGSLPTEERDITLFHATAYCRAAVYLLHITGIRADGRNVDHTVGCRISIDDNIYFNPDCTPVRMEQPTELPSEELASLSDIKSLMPASGVLPGYSTDEMDVLRYNFVCRQLANEHPKDDDTYIVALAEKCNRAGIKMDTAVRCTMHRKIFVGKQMLVNTSFEQAYESKRSGRTSIVPQQLINQELMIHYLEARYRFRQNEIMGTLEYVDTNLYVTKWKQLNDSEIKSICIEVQKAGILVWENDIERFVKSSKIPTFNPIGEWIASLPKWDGRDRIAELAATVDSDWEHWTEYFGTWMRAMVTQWMACSPMYGATMVLMLIGGQGAKKSTFMRRILPPELLTYYNDRLDFTNRKEAERALMRFTLINIDEYDQISRSQTAYLKHILQKSDIKWRKMYQDDITQRQRYAAFCATTNSSTPLVDPTGSRRYLCIEVGDKGIDTSYVIDYEQLYAQIIHEINIGMPTYFDAEAESIIQLHNAPYTVEVPLRTMFYELFSAPSLSTSHLSVLLSSAEILTELKHHFVNLRTDETTAIRLGKILTNDKIQRTRTHECWKYKVIRKASIA